MSVHVVDGSYREVLSSHDGSPASARGAVLEVLKFIGEPKSPQSLNPKRCCSQLLLRSTLQCGSSLLGRREKKSPNPSPLYNPQP